MRAVLRKKSNPVGGGVVQGMRIGIAGHEIETMIVASGQSSLQAVVRRCIRIREVVDDSEVGGLAIDRVRARRCLSTTIGSANVGIIEGLIAGGDFRRTPPRPNGWLIEIPDTNEFHATIAYISSLQGKFAGEGMLDTNGPVFNVGGTEVAVHGEGVARAGVVGTSCMARTVSTLDQSSNVSGIDCRGLIHPGNARPRDGDSGCEDVANAGRGGRGIAGDNGSAGGDGAETQRDGILCILLREERVHRQKAVDETPSGADDSGALSGHVPSDPEARGEILVVAFIDRVDVLPHLFEASRRLPIPEKVVGLAGNALELIAKT